MVFGFFDGSIPAQWHDNLIKFFTVPRKMDNITTHHYSWENPLPALVSIKYSTDGDHEKFYALDPSNIWNLLPMKHHVYKDLVQALVQQILARSFIMFFKTVKYQ